MVVFMILVNIAPLWFRVVVMFFKRSRLWMMVSFQIRLWASKLVNLIGKVGGIVGFGIEIRVGTSSFTARTIRVDILLPIVAGLTWWAWFKGKGAKLPAAFRGWGIKVGGA